MMKIANDEALSSFMAESSVVVNECREVAAVKA